MNFTDEEREELESLLRKYDPKPKAWFIFGLSDICQTYHHLKKPIDMADHRGTVNQIKKRLEATLKDLKWLTNHGLTPQATMHDTGGPALVEQIRGMQDSEEVIRFTYPALKQLLIYIDGAESNLDSQKPKRGRLPADHIGLVYEIAKLYAKHLERPTMGDSIRFKDVVTWTLDYLDLPFADPKRALTAALNKLK